MAAWPNRSEADSRPPLGAAYQQVAAVPPAHPAVPAGAPAALRAAASPPAWTRKSRQEAARPGRGERGPGRYRAGTRAG